MVPEKGINNKLRIDARACFLSKKLMPFNSEETMDFIFLMSLNNLNFLSY